MRVWPTDSPEATTGPLWAGGHPQSYRSHEALAGNDSREETLSMLRGSMTGNLGWDSPQQNAAGSCKFFLGLSQMSKTLCKYS